MKEFSKVGFFSPNQQMIGQFVLYTAFGAMGTGAHYLTLFFLVHQSAVDPVLASATGFVVGAIVNYNLNYFFTFKSSSRHLRSGARFFSVAAAGLTLNSGVMYVTVHQFDIPYFLGQLFATGTVLVLTFLVNRRWTFGNQNLG